MKLLHLLLLGVALGSARASSLSLEAHEIGTGSATITNWEDTAGDTTRILIDQN